MDFQCDLNCPPQFKGNRKCCGWCGKQRDSFLKEHPELQSLFDKELGFWSEQGCKLTVEQRPKECKEFNCKNSATYFIRFWDGNNWIDYIHTIKSKNGEIWHAQAQNL